MSSTPALTTAPKTGIDSDSHRFRNSACSGAARGRALSRFVAALSLVATLAGTVAPALAQSLDRKVETILSDPKLGAAKTGVVIMDASEGTLLASRRADDAFIPASNMKLITSGAALTVLGPQFTFRTELVHVPGDGTPGSQRVIFRGSGDPTLGDPGLLDKAGTTAESILEKWVGALKKAGVTPGAELIIDDRVFDREFVHPTWPVEQLNRWYCSEVSGANFHANLLRIYANPQAQGRPPALKVEPKSPWIDVRNKARSVASGNQTAWAARESDNSLTLYGDVRWANDPVEISLTDTPNFLGRLLADRMRAAGMAPVSVRTASANEDLSGGTVVHAEETPLADVLRRCNVDSYNLYAECLIKRLGHEVTHTSGSWANGSAVVRMVLSDQLGAKAGQSMSVADGSGMSRQNKVTPMLLAEWLEAMIKDQARGEQFIQSLAEAGDEGTLARRFRGPPLSNTVRAKTGYLSGVSAISGYVVSPDRSRKVIFVIITNDKPNSVPLSLVRQSEESIVRLADGWLRDKVGGPGSSTGSR